jgi:hypothetical protein
VSIGSYLIKALTFLVPLCITSNLISDFTASVESVKWKFSVLIKIFIHLTGHDLFHKVVAVLFFVEKAHYQTQCGRLTELEKDLSTSYTGSAFPHFMALSHQTCINHVKNWAGNIFTVTTAAVYCTACSKQLRVYWVKAARTGS